MTQAEMLAARKAVRLAIARHPGLGATGFPAPRRLVGCDILAHENKIALNEVAHAIAFFQLCTPARSPRCSYALKHEIEGWYRANGVEVCISNGAAVAAAIYVGLSVTPRHQSLNGDVGISTRGVWRAAA